MNELLQQLESFYAVVVLFVTGLGSLYAWNNRRKSKQKESDDMLLNSLYEMKNKVIIHVESEVELRKLNSEKDAILNEIKSTCPDCYEKAVQKQKLS